MALSVSVGTRVTSSCNSCTALSLASNRVKMISLSAEISRCNCCVVSSVGSGIGLQLWSRSFLLSSAILYVSVPIVAMAPFSHFGTYLAFFACCIFSIMAGSEFLMITVQRRQLLVWFLRSITFPQCRHTAAPQCVQCALTLLSSLADSQR